MLPQSLRAWQCVGIWPRWLRLLIGMGVSLLAAVIAFAIWMWPVMHMTSLTQTKLVQAEHLKAVKMKQNDKLNRRYKKLCAQIDHWRQVFKSYYIDDANAKDSLATLSDLLQQAGMKVLSLQPSGSNQNLLITASSTYQAVPKLIARLHELPELYEISKLHMQMKNNETKNLLVSLTLRPLPFIKSALAGYEGAQFQAKWIMPRWKISQVNSNFFQLALPVAVNFQKSPHAKNMSPLHDSPSQLVEVPLTYVQAKSFKEVVDTAVKAGIVPKNLVFTFDARTNEIIVAGPSEDIKKFRRFVEKLDVPLKQVKIGVKIVAVDTRALKELGVNWKSLGHHTIGALDGIKASVHDIAINTGVAHPSGQIGLLFDKLPLGFQVNLQLQALESEGEGKVISSPTLAVFNHHKAYIEQGKEIPFQAAVTTGVTQVQFKKAVLGLWVTPIVTSAHQVLLNVKINNDTVANDVGKAGTTPIIDTTQMKTEISVQDGQTVVLGGIETKLTADNVKKVPWLADIPGLGALFKSHYNHQHTAELLVFVTPKIME